MQGFGPFGTDRHARCHRIDLTVDAVTRVLVRFGELADAGPITTRALRIEAVDSQVDPSALAANVRFGAYELQPPPVASMVMSRVSPL